MKLEILKKIFINAKEINRKLSTRKLVIDVKQKTVLFTQKSKVEHIIEKNLKIIEN